MGKHLEHMGLFLRVALDRGRQSVLRLILSILHDPTMLNYHNSEG